MNADIDSAVSSLLVMLDQQQREAHAANNCCTSYGEVQSVIPELSYTVVPYFNPKHGCGFGVRFTFTGPSGVMEKSVDRGFLSGAPRIHAVLDHDWRAPHTGPIA